MRKLLLFTLIFISVQIFAISNNFIFTNHFPDMTVKIDCNGVYSTTHITNKFVASYEVIWQKMCNYSSKLQPPVELTFRRGNGDFLGRATFILDPKKDTIKIKNKKITDLMTIQPNKQNQVFIAFGVKPK